MALLWHMLKHIHQNCPCPTTVVCSTVPRFITKKVLNINAVWHRFALRVWKLCMPSWEGKEKSSHHSSRFFASDLSYHWFLCLCFCLLVDILIPVSHSAVAACIFRTDGSSENSNFHPGSVSNIQDSMHRKKSCTSAYFSGLFSTIQKCPKWRKV